MKFPRNLHFWALVAVILAGLVLTSHAQTTAAAAPPSVWIKENGVGAVNGTNRIFMLARVPDPAGLGVFLSGRYESPNDDYVVLNGNWLVFNVAPPSGSVVRFWYRSLVLAP